MNKNISIQISLDAQSNILKKKENILELVLLQLNRLNHVQSIVKMGEEKKRKKNATK